MNFSNQPSIDECRIIELPRRMGDNGSLTEVENADGAPFRVRRVYYIYDVPACARRGGHAHMHQQQLLVAVNGAFSVTLDDGARRRTVRLDRPFQALYISPGIWRTMQDFSSGSVCLVLASEKYEDADYVRDYAEYLRLARPGSAICPAMDLWAVNAPYAAGLKEAACRVIDSGRYIGGPEVEAFESELAQAIGVPFAVVVANGLDALRLILRAYIELGRLRRGQEVIVPGNTFIASVLAITDCGLKPVFVDADEGTMNMDLDRVAEAVTPLTGAIMPVHLYGRACWSPALAELAERRGLIVVEDNAQAIGAQADGPGLFGSCGCGSLGHAAGISFYPTKNVGALGDGGAVLTHDAELARVVRALANYGTDRQYHNVYAGLNSRLDPMQAAMMRVKLKSLDEENARRRRQAAYYDEHIDNPRVIKPEMPSAAASHVWHQYVVRVADREKFRAFLLSQGIGTGVHYPIPPHKQPCYSEYAGLSLPVSERLASEVVSLPLYADARVVAEAVNRYRD